MSSKHKHDPMVELGDILVAYLEQLGVEMVARLGGDEFAVVIDRVKSQDSLSRIANTTCETLDKPFSFAGKEIFVSTSIGIAIFPDDGTDIDSLMKHADAAMFRAKDFGRNYMFYGEHGGECYLKD